MTKTTTAMLLCVLGASAMVAPVIGQAGQKAPPAPKRAAAYVRLQQSRLFTYQELVTLGTTDEVGGRLADKLSTITTTPFLSNEAYFRGARPHQPARSLRLVTWNIERGLEVDGIKLLFTNSEEFLRQAARKEADVNISQMRQDIDVLKSADVLVLNEVDWGMKRTGYRTVVEELGTALNMNWAYGVEFIEVDPISLGTETLEEVEDPAERRQLLAEIQVDKKKLKALHGTVVLSRYPIRQARLAPFKTVGYDWYTGEKKALDPLEKGERLGAQAALLEKVKRQIRRGGRMALIVTLDVPNLKEQRLTVAATHLESNASPESRKRQMEELLLLLQDIPNPVVIAGDLNTTGSNSSPTSIKKQVYHRLGSASFWTNTAVKYATGFGLFYDAAQRGLNTAKNQDDPTARDIPLVGPNPEAELFSLLEEYRFKDGFTFDFRGDKERTINGTEGTLANSNQRDTKGFVTTFEFERNLGVVGKLKLDWILVKAYAASPRDDKEPYRFAPRYAQTLGSINYALPTRLSDHDPISVELPFDEPAPLDKKQGSQ